MASTNFVFKYCQGARDIQRIECDFNEARRNGNELAEQIGAVKMYAYNSPVRRWEYMGTFHGNMEVTNSFGEKCTIKPDFSGLEHKNQEGGAS